MTATELLLLLFVAACYGLILDCERGNNGRH